MSITADSIYSFLFKIGILSVSESNKIVLGPGAPTPMEELTALLQIRWSTGECDLYTVPVFLPLDAFGVLVLGGPKN